MNKKLLIVIVGLILIIAGSLTYVFVLRNNQQVETNQREVKNTVDPSSSLNKTDKTTAKGMYLPYSSEAVAAAKGKVLLFFHAPWCPQCRAIEQSIEEDGVPSDVTILKVDYDSNQALRQKYGVTLQTTFVKVDSQGNKLASYTAYDEPTFSAVRRELLP
jgi:thiol-disulfide isomerase/thioredoxin